MCSTKKQRDSTIFEKFQSSRNYSGAEFVVHFFLALLLSSHHEKVIKWHLFLFKKRYWVKYGNVFTQIMMFSLKKVDDLRVRERDREEKETINSAPKSKTSCKIFWMYGFKCDFLKLFWTHYVFFVHFRVYYICKDNRTKLSQPLKLLFSSNPTFSIEYQCQPICEVSCQN